MFSRSKHLLSKNIPIQGVTRLPQFGVSDGGIWELRLLSHYYLKCNLAFLVGRRSMNYVGPDLSSSLKNPDGHPPRGVPQCPSTHGLWCEAHLGAQNPASPIPPADTSPPWPLVTSCSIRCSTSSVFLMLMAEIEKYKTSLAYSCLFLDSTFPLVWVRSIHFDEAICLVELLGLFPPCYSLLLWDLQKCYHAQK